MVEIIPTVEKKAKPPSAFTSTTFKTKEKRKKENGAHTDSIVS